MTNLMKTHYRDLRLDEPDNYGLLSIIVENAARRRPPLPVGQSSDFMQRLPCATDTNIRHQVHADGSVSWDIPSLYYAGFPEEPGEHGWVGLYARFKNISLREATSALAQNYGISPEAPMEIGSKISPHKNMDEARFRPYDGVRYPEHAKITIDGVPAEIDAVMPIAGPYGGVGYVLCVWKTSDGKIVHYPYYKIESQPGAPTNHDFRQWGFETKSIPLSGLDVLERFQQADVVVTDDAWCASWINSVLGLLDKEKHGNVVAVSFWAGASRVSDCSFAPLAGRNVVYVPTLHKDSLTVGVKLADIFEKVGARSFRGLMTPLASDVDQVEASRMECGDEACDRAAVFSARSILYMLDDISHAWEPERYKRFCEQEGLIESSRQDDEGMSPPMFLPASHISDAAKQEGTGQDFSFESVFDPTNITVIVGESDAGKSLFARTLAVGMATGTDAFGMRASKSRDVYVLNAEQDARKSEAHTQRAMSALGVDQIPDNLFDRPELSMSDQEGLGRVDIFNESWQDKIVENITVGSVLIVDNLLATSDKNLSQPNVARSLTAFARRLSQKHISLIIVHHTNKDGSAMGSNALESLAQNFILIHKADMSTGFEGGVNARVTFQKIKSYPPYTGKKFGAHLRLTYTSEAEAAWVFVAEGGDAPSPPVRAKPDVAGLHRIDQVALTIAYEKNRVTRRDLVALGYNKETAKDHLKQLCEQGELVLQGKGAGAHYVPPGPSVPK